MLPKSTITLENHLDRKNPIRKTGYHAKSLRVNGHSISDIVPNVFFEARKQQVDAITSDIIELVGDSYGPMVRDKMRLMGTHAFPRQRLINLTSLENGDDLVTLFHERVHLDDTTLTDDYFRATRRLLTKSIEYQLGDYAQALQQLAGTETTQQRKRHMAPKLFADLERVVTWERNANVHALQRLRGLNAPLRLFTTDDDLVRVKKSMQVQLLSYTNFNKGSFNPFLTKEQKQRLDALAEV